MSGCEHESQRFFLMSSVRFAQLRFVHQVQIESCKKETFAIFVFWKVLISCFCCRSCLFFGLIGLIVIVCWLLGSSFLYFAGKVMLTCTKSSAHAFRSGERFWISVQGAFLQLQLDLFYHKSERTICYYLF